MSLSVPGGELPFLMEIDRSDNALHATLINGTERVKSRDVGLLDNRLVVNFNVFNSRIDASLEGGILVGSLSTVKEGGREQVIPLTAEHGKTQLFAEDGEAPSIDVSGRWEVVFRDQSGNSTVAVGEFVQQSTRLSGTFLTSTGDYRYLTGDVHGNRIRLSCFDGYHAFLFHAEVNNQGVMRGDFWSGTQWHETWTAVRNDNAALPDPTSLTFLKPGFDRFNFSFPDTTGRLVSLTNDRFANKVILISISGTWCPNCNDEAAFLRSLHAEYRDRGLEIVSLMYEHVGNFNAAARQVREFARWHDIDYDLLIAGTSSKTEASKTLPMLNHVIAYPTTIFVDRTRRVRKIHTGWSGPGTGEHFRDLAREFREYVDFLLAERLPASS